MGDQMSGIRMVSNRMGILYTIETCAPGKTRITLCQPSKSIVVNVPQAEVEEAWFNWTGRGAFVQEAFRFLNSDDREFIMTGITPEQWEATFGKK